MGGSSNDDRTEVIHRGKAKVALEWGSKSLLVIIPALATGYFSMRESRIAADIEMARINAKAAAGYETLVEAVKEMDGRVKASEDEARKLATFAAKLELRLDTLATTYVDRVEEEPSTARRRGGGGIRSSTIETIMGRGAAATPVEPDKLFKAGKPAAKAARLPKTLEDAVEQMKK